jgi:diguanylate cyclase (GGDEF)-like protein
MMLLLRQITQHLRRLRRLGVTPQQSPALRRQIVLTNQLCLLCILLPSCYQLFYLLHNPLVYWPILLVNCLFMFSYLLPLGLNARQLHQSASLLALTLSSAHLFVDSALLSSASGAHLLYFALGAGLALIFRQYGQLRLVSLALLLSGLFVLVEWLFPRSAAIVVVPSPYIEIMYALTALAGLTLATGFSFTFRQAMVRSEASLRRVARELEQLSLTDELTRLPNRRALEQVMERESGRAVRYAQPLAVLMIDVDYFKAFNDHYGHDTGDQCLGAVASVLQQSLHRQADLVARYGGEEFCIVLPDTSEQGALQVSDRVLNRMRNLDWPHAKSPVAPYVTVSIGYAVQEMTPDDDVQALREQADIALYRAKASGRACVRGYAGHAGPAA